MIFFFFLKITRRFECLHYTTFYKDRIFRTIHLSVEEFMANPNLYKEVKRKETKQNKQQFIISPKQYPAVLKREKTP
jgi:hypothetical protein